MSPDTNHNEIIESKAGMCHKINGMHMEAIVPEEMLNKKGLILHNIQRVATTGGFAEEVPIEHISAKTTVGEHSVDDANLKEYLERSDTVVIYPEPVGRLENGK